MATSNTPKRNAFGDRIAEAATALRSLTAAGRTNPAVVLAREAIETAMRSYESVDDSASAD